ncbi:MAG: 3'-5' exonuclease [Spirochaetaceae bacterium]|nr:MAG: 3'-5' exonuclease [Spirochaetaceae bacterium]
MHDDAAVSKTIFAAFDFETTGLHAGLDRIVEVGIVRFRGDQILGELGTLVNPGMEIPDDAAAVSGITTDMVTGADPIDVVLPDFMALCDNAVLIAHNASFDMGFLRAALQSAGLPDVTNRVIDTQVLAQRAFPRQRSYALQSLVELVGLPENSAHRALDDAVTCMRLFHACADALSFMGEVQLRDVYT